MNLELLPLLLFSALILGSAAAAMTRRNLIHSALLLVLSWAGIAGFYLWAGAEFVGFAQILVYVGAVSMVVLFAVLLTRRSHEDAFLVEPATLARVAGGLVAAGAVCGVLCGAVLASPFARLPKEAPVVTVKQIGDQLMGPQVAGMLIVGVILTVALLGAIVLAAQTDSKPDDVP